MLFSTTLFLFLFLPLVLAGYHLVPGASGRNVFLLLASLFFYAWGEGVLVLTLLLSIGMNYGFGRLLDRGEAKPRAGWIAGLAVAANLALLAVFKYAALLLGALNVALRVLRMAPVAVAPWRLPIGLSFFTFQALSYVLDVYRRRGRVQRNPVNIALYIALFPQLILGPIIRYRDIARQFGGRKTTLEGFAEGVSRFSIGLGKKVLIADTLARAVNPIFALPLHQLTPGLAWLAVGGFTLQLYFDFSGYSDMAIGIGRMFGFRFRENFNYPYVARSRGEYFQRWHISFFTWLRDYVYRPLTGRHASPARRNFSVLAVFLLAGLWHGARPTFLAWGVFNGVAVVVERLGLEARMRTWLPPWRHGYFVVLALVSNALFRAQSLPQAGTLIASLAGFAPGTGIAASAWNYLDREILVALVAGAVGCLPVVPALKKGRARLAPAPDGESAALRAGWDTLEVAGTSLVLAASILVIASGTYTPFFYFRF